MMDEPKEPTGKDADPLFSTLLAECPELGDIVEQFVRSLPDRVAGMQAALHDGSVERLCAQAHQLKGAGASHGYELVSRKAAEIEQIAFMGVMDGLAEKLNEITAMIQRIREGLQPSS